MQIAGSRTSIDRSIHVIDYLIRQSHRSIGIHPFFHSIYIQIAMASKEILYTPIKVGAMDLAHRIVYAPLTRCRSFNSIPQPIAAQYYSQRATEGGLMITEGTVISETGHGYPCTPGIYTQEMIDNWKPIVKSVHDKGAKFFMQIWHVGRASHPHYQPDEALPIAPSAVAINDGTQAFSLKTMGMVEYPVPRALDKSELPGIANDFRLAARNAIAAGFDGVEIHGANGYLLDNFLKEESNKRTDEYGGSVENRCRFLLEVVQAVVEEVGAERVGIRFSPFGGFMVAADADPYAVYLHLLEKLPKDLAYVHFVEPRAGGNSDRDPGEYTLEPFKKAWSGTFMAAGGYTPDNSVSAIENGVDLIAYGRWYLANPDFVKRVRLGAPLNKYDRSTFYSQGSEGYVDYPFIEDTEWGKENAELLKNDA